MRNTQTDVPVMARKTKRRLKPEVLAQQAAKRRNEELNKLYETPVEELSPEDIAKMKAAFFLR
jgi:hypothetical protein